MENEEKIPWDDEQPVISDQLLDQLLAGGDAKIWRSG